jgi:hypothetical protein
MSVGGGEGRDGIVIARILERLRASIDRIQGGIARLDAPFAAVRRSTARLERAIATLSRPPSLRFAAPSYVWRAGEGWSTRPRTFVDALVDPATPAAARRLIAEHLAALTGWWWDLACPGQIVTEDVLARRVAELLLTADDAMADGQKANIHRKWVKDARGRRWVGRRIDLPSRALFAEWFFQRLAAHLRGDVRCGNACDGDLAVDNTTPLMLLLDAEQDAAPVASLDALLAARPDVLAMLSAVERDTLDHRHDPVDEEAERHGITADAVYKRRERLWRKVTAAVGRPAP